MKHRTVVIDISNMIWANYHNTILYIPNDDPRCVTAVLNKTLQSVSLAIEATHATQAFCATDLGGRAAYRAEASPLYKSNRGDTPSSVPASQEAMCGILDKFGIPSLIVPGYEADDIYAQIARHFTYEGLGTVTGVSRDNDWTLPVAFCGGNVALYDQKTKKTLHEHTLRQQAEEEFGMEIPDLALYRYVLYSKCMVGDKSDVIEGWKGVGKVGAKELARWQTALDFNLQIDPEAYKKAAKKRNKITNYEEVLLTNRTLIDPYHCLTVDPVLEAIEGYVPDPVDLSEEELDEMLFTSLAKCWGRLNAYQARKNLIDGGDVDSLPPFLRCLLDVPA